MDLREEIELYTPFNAQEEADRHVMLRALDCGSTCFERTAPLPPSPSVSCRKRRALRARA